MPLTFNPFGSTRRVAPSLNADEQRKPLLSPEERASNTQTGAAGSFFSRVETSPNQMPNGQSDFLKACRDYNIEIVEKLFNAGAKITGGTLDKLDFEKDREKFKLFKNNANPNKVQIYIDYLNQIKELGKGDLCLALENDSDSGSFDSSKKLIKQNPYLVDIRIDSYGRTPLMFVSEKLSEKSGSKKHFEDMFDFLIANKADLNLVDHKGETALCKACGDYNIEIVETLFNAGAKITGGTLDKLDFEKDREKFELFKNNANPNKGQIYIDYLNQIKELGKGDLCLALENDSDSGSFDSSKKLIKQNPYLVDIRIDSHGITPLMFVSEKLSEPGSKKHFEDMFNFLIANKADLNLVDHKGETVLFKACANNNANLVNKLLQHGAMSNEGRVNIEKLLSSASPEMKSLIGKYLPKSSEPGPDPRPLQAKPLSQTVSLFQQ